MATILDPRFKKDGFQQSSNADQEEIGFENKLVDLHNKENPNILNMELDSNPQDPDSFFDFMDQRAIFKQRNGRADAILSKRKYLERAIAPQEMGERMQF